MLLFMMHCLLAISGLTMTFLFPAGVANCSPVEAKTPELADVKAAMVSAHENDTVNVPPETASWTSTLIITKGITTIQANRDFYNQKPRLLAQPASEWVSCQIGQKPAHRGLRTGRPTKASGTARTTDLMDNRMFAPRAKPGHRITNLTAIHIPWLQQIPPRMRTQYGINKRQTDNHLRRGEFELHSFAR